MIDDFINMTQGQLLMKYWWIYLSLTGVGVLVILHEIYRSDNNRDAE